MVLVDSSVWIEAGRREGKLSYKVGLENLLGAYEATWCGPVKLEVLGAARPQDRKRLESYFSIIPYKAMEDGAWDFAKNCYQRLRDQGHTLPFNDALLGSLSLIWNCRVYSADQHFEIMRDVIGIRLYQPGYGGKYESDVNG
ncbi:MAG: VapC toxin family PIN domain ribonuclease [Verrucomicrobia bacterium]|nr:VapC toxin family PIN domain ribonuclease [Verrucomicrobiota bacterium]